MTVKSKGVTASCGDFLVIYSQKNLCVSISAFKMFYLFTIEKKAN